VVTAGASVTIAVESRQDGPIADGDSSNAMILAALQALAADRGSAVPGAAPDPADPGIAPIPAAAPGTKTPAPGVVDTTSMPSVAVPGPAPEAAAAPAQPPAPTAYQLTAVLHSAVDPSRPLDVRAQNVERGGEATAVLTQIGERAGTMLRVVQPTIVDPVAVDGDTASGLLQVTFAGAAGPQTPLRLAFRYLDGTWVLSARSVCDIASFNGFACPPGYAN
jgi:hypothetical protein